MEIKLKTLIDFWNYFLNTGFNILLIKEGNRLMKMKVDFFGHMLSINCSLTIGGGSEFSRNKWFDVILIYSFTDLKNPGFETSSQILNSLARLSARVHDIHSLLNH